jgi:hypothetical protein
VHFIKNLLYNWTIHPERICSLTSYIWWKRVILYKMNL